MKKNLKNLYFGLVNTAQTIVSILCVCIYSRFRVNKALRQIIRGGDDRPASVIANGPSAREILDKRTDLINNTDVIVLNYFGNTDDFFKIKPRYYIIVDPSFFDPKWQNMEVREKEKRSTWSAKQQLQDAFKRVDWKMTLFAPYTKSARKTAHLYISNPNIELVWINCTRIEGFNWFEDFMYYKNLGVPSSINVLIPALQTMVNLGYSKIYLYGAEFSWTKYLDVDVNNGRIYQNDVHFYGDKDISYLTRGTYRTDLLSVADALLATEKLERLAKRQNSKIINRTKGSFIDAFEYENPDLIIT